MFIVLTKYTHRRTHTNTRTYTHTHMHCQAVQTLYDDFIVGRRACDALETQFAPYRPLASSSSLPSPSSQILPGFLFNVGCEFVASCFIGMASICCQSEQSRQEEGSTIASFIVNLIGQFHEGVGGFK